MMNPSENLLWRAGGPARHEKRVTATLAAADKLADGDVALAAFLQILDLHGVGGRLGCEGIATQRLLSGNLGSGRWQAGDGAAYRASAQEALRRRLPQLVGEFETYIIHTYSIRVVNPDLIAIDVDGLPFYIRLSDVVAVTGELGEAFILSFLARQVAANNRYQIGESLQSRSGYRIAWDCDQDPELVAAAYDWWAVEEGADYLILGQVRCAYVLYLCSGGVFFGGELTVPPWEKFSLGEYYSNWQEVDDLLAKWGFHLASTCSCEEDCECDEWVIIPMWEVDR